jgi:hypothetical protein
METARVAGAAAKWLKCARLTAENSASVAFEIAGPAYENAKKAGFDAKKTLQKS